MKRLRFLFFLSVFLSAGVMLCASCGDDDDETVDNNFVPYCKVAFDTDGGSKVEPVMVKPNDKASKPDDPKKAGYEFLGWYYNDALFDFSTAITADIELRAKWKLQYDDVLPGVFSVARDKKVMFSKGNLQYQTSTKTWRFAEHQSDYCFDQSGNVKDFWIDLFGWGMWIEGQNPVEKDRDASKYFGDLQGGVLTGESAIGKGWNVLSIAEWMYLLGIGDVVRDNAPYLHNYITLNGVEGLVILPDGTDSATLNWKDWASLEALGAVFLPTSGVRDDTDILDLSFAGYYWTRTADGDSKAFLLGVNKEKMAALVASRYLGLSVRLVREFWD